MKNMKKLFAILLAVVMVMGLATTAFADEATQTTYTITIDNSVDGYSYEAYQVFKGDVTEKDNELENIAWGDGVDGDALLVALKAIEVNEVKPFENCVTAVDVADVLNDYQGKDNAVAQEFADAVAANLTTVSAGKDVDGSDGYAITVNEAGYYFVKSIGVPAADDEDGTGAHTRYILKVAGNVTVTHKGDVPSVEKKIVEDGDKDAIDASIGDDVNFKLTATLPSEYSYYKQYKLVFHDTLSSGLTLDTESFVVTVAGVTLPDTEYSVVTENLTDGCTFHVVINDLKVVKNAAGEVIAVNNSDKVIVTYSAELNTNAVIGEPGNPNTVKLEYSNDPNWKADPEKPDEEEPTGKTPEDKVVVFTFELDITKVDGVNNTIKLDGAEFVLYKEVEGTKLYYTYVEAVEDDEATADDESKPATVEWVADKNNADVLTTVNGVFAIKGLDSGTYYLEETKAPEGYNLPTAPFTVVITATVAEDGITSLTASVGGENATTDADNGTVSGTIANNSGATLPETGGIGTTIFYVLGGVLVLAAVVLLVTKRRMNVAE